MTKNEFFARLILAGWEEYDINNGVKPQKPINNKYYTDGKIRVHTNSSDLLGDEKTIRMAMNDAWFTYSLYEAWELIYE